MSIGQHAGVFGLLAFSVRSSVSKSSRRPVYKSSSQRKIRLFYGRHGQCRLFADLFIPQFLALGKRTIQG